MLIRIEDTYRGYVLRRVLEPGEHEVPDSVGEYLIENMGGAPFFARRVDVAPSLEMKPAYDMETKPMMPAEVKAEPEPVRRPVPRPRPKVKP